jgi:glycosyltransferase involved in cell wall biosynthesis
MNEFRPDIVFTYGVTGLQPLMARRFLGAWRCPIVHGWEDCYADIWASLAGRPFGWLVHQLERQIIRRSDFITTPSLALQNRARAWGKQTWRIPNGAEEIPPFDRAKCTLKLQGAMTLVHLGDQGKYKHTEDVVKAMASVPKDVRLYLVGVPNPDLLKYAAENVIFTGPVSWADLWGVLEQADVLVCTAHQDCNGKFYHYLRARKPILAYDGDPNLQFKNRVNALLTRDYAAAIMELYAAPDLRRRLAENAARDIRVYTWAEVAQQFDGVFREILSLHATASGQRREGTAPVEGIRS